MLRHRLRYGAFIEEDAVKITVVAVGKLKERFWADACAEYVKRLGAYATVKMVEVADRDPAKSGGEEAGRELEGKGILAAIPERSHVVLLDIGGKERSSEEIASHLDDLMLRGGELDHVRDRRIVRRLARGARPCRRAALVRAHHVAAQSGARGVA